jgi:signal transduction histidine kinase
VGLIAAILSAIAAGLSAQERPSGSLPLLTRIQDIRALSQDEGQRGYPVRFRATVTHFDEVLHTTLIVHDGAYGQFISPPANSPKFENWNQLKAGQLVEIEGRTERGGFAPNVVPLKIRRLGDGPKPLGKRLTFSELLTGRYDCDYVDVSGVIQRAWLANEPKSRVMYADVAIGDGVVRAAFWDSLPNDASRFIDARVHLEGNIGTIFGPSEQLRGLSLFAGRIQDIVVLESPPDPFSLPERSIQRIFNYSSIGEVNRRIRVRGVVTAWIPGPPVEIRDFTTSATFRYVNNVLYLKDATGHLRLETEQSLEVHPGDVVEAAGFPAVTVGKPMLRNAVFRAVGTASEPKPVDLDAVAERDAREASASEVRERRKVLTPDYDAELVTLNARLLSVQAGSTERVLVLSAGDAVFDARIRVSGNDANLRTIRDGSLLSVTGVYSYQGGPPPSFGLFLRRPEDVRMLAAAPWWTLRDSVITTIIFALAIGVGGWRIRTLTARKHLEYQAVLNERSRVARELHDTVEQGLSGIALQLEAVEGSLQTAPDTARQSLGIAQQMVRYSLEETRRSVMDLRAQALERGDLAGALETLARQMTLYTSALANVYVRGPVQRLDASTEHHLLRIGLEALTNALKHGRATRIDIDLSFTPQSTRLIVTDNGRGLEWAERATGGAHFGLQGVRERVDKLGGALDISSTGAGTRLAVTIPARIQEPTTHRVRFSEI